MRKWNVEIIMTNGATIGPFPVEGDSASDILSWLLSGNDYSFNSIEDDRTKTFYRVRDVSVMRFELEEK